jgi:hypothetical protein
MQTWKERHTGSGKECPMCGTFILNGGHSQSLRRMWHFCPPAQSDFCSFDPMVFCSQCGCRTSMLFCRSSTGEVLCCSEDIRSGASLVSKVSITVVVQSRLLILGIHATAHWLSSASILLVPPLFFAHSQSHSRFIAIVLRAISSRCRPLHPCHKSQHPSLAGAPPLERVYCHESRYVSYSLKL